MAVSVSRSAGAVAVAFMVVALVVAATLGSGGCGPAAIAPAICPNDVPETCPTPAPTFANQVDGIIQNRCAACHSPGGVEAVRPLQTWDQLRSQKISVLSQIHSCLMPPADQPQLTADERQAVLGWIVCGAADD